MVHAHASDERRIEEAGLGADDDAGLIGGRAEDAVAVAEGHEADPAARGRDPGSPVRGGDSLFDDLDGGQRGAQLEGGDKAKFVGSGDRGVRAQAVQADADADHVVVGFGMPQDARRGGDVTDARGDAGVGEDRQALLEDAHVVRGRGVALFAGIVGARHVAPRTHNVDEAVICGHAQGRGQGGQVG